MYAFSLAVTPTAFESMVGESVYVLVQNSPEWSTLQDKYAGLVLWEKPRFNLKTHPEVFGRRI